MNKTEIVDRAFNEGTIEAVNAALIAGCGAELIQRSEIFHSRQFTTLADEIADRLDTRLVLIAGPSSSGKTSTSKRLSIQLKVLGINPVVINMDDYFVPRELTPRDENGNWDFECIGALDVELLNRQLNELFDGREVNLPTFDFVRGDRFYNPEKKAVLGKNDIVVMEGIHGLNPALTASIPDSNKYRIYASVINSLNIPGIENTSYATRLLRRMVRDFNFRGNSPVTTVLRWPSVRAGEEKNIVPYMDNADARFDSSLIYEVPLFKCYVDTMLRGVPADSEAYPICNKLLQFIMKEIASLTPNEINMIPSTSVVREFIGGSSFIY